jgi:hypothetical protein
MAIGYLITIALGVVASAIFFVVVKLGGSLRHWFQKQWVERRRKKANEEMIEHLREIEGKDGFL